MGRSSSKLGHSRHTQTALVASALSLFLLSTAGRAQEGELLLDRIAAVVSNYPILYSEIEQKVKTGPLVIVSDYPAKESDPPYEKGLHDAINFQLIKQKCKEMELEVREEDVDKEIAGFLETRQLTKDGLMDFLKQEGRTFESYKDDFRDQMLLRRFQGRIINPLVKVTERDVETFFLKKSGTTADLVELSLRQLLIAIPAGGSAEIIQAKEALAREVFQKLQGGMPFVDAVKLYSDAPQARTSGGLMAGIRLKDLAEIIQGPVEALEVGKYTVPIKTAAGFQLFSLEEKKFAGGSEFQKQKKQLEFELANQELMTQTRRWLSEQRQKSEVKILEN